MGRVRQGYVFEGENGEWYARMTYVDNAGKRRNLKRTAKNVTEAKKKLKGLDKEIEGILAGYEAPTVRTFNELADYYDKTCLIPAVYRDDRKIAGLRSLKTPQGFLVTLREHFGDKAIRSISRQDIKAYKLTRLQSVTKRGTLRSIASVDRELGLLRSMFSVALDKEWVVRNPFAGETLIDVAHEKKRIVSLTYEEEDRILAACTGRRAHVRPILICALDTGMRSGEIFKLTWANVDLEKRAIRIVAMTTKTMTERSVTMTGRLHSVLSALWALSTQEPTARVFGISAHVNRSWYAIRKSVGRPDLRIHDLRHVTASRLVAGGMDLSEVGKILGHAQPQTTYRYANATDDTLARAAAILERI